MSTDALIACVGLATADTIVSFATWPERDGRTVVDSIDHAGGGPAATAAVTIARLGGRAALVAAVGDDAAGSTVRAGLQQTGVELDGIVTLPGATAQSVILVDRSAGSRAILHAPGVTMPGLDAAALGTCEAAAWVHVDHAGYPLVTAVDPARVSVDAGNPIPGLSLRGLGLYGPTSAALAERYPGSSVLEAIGRALADGARRVAVTLGADGAIAADGSGAWRAVPPAVPVTSTLGAGDVFHGALLAGLAAERPLPDALRRATLAAALSCRAVDGRSAIPSGVELEAALDRSPPLEPIMLEPMR